MVNKKFLKGIVKKVVTVAVAVFVMTATVAVGTTTVFAEETETPAPETPEPENPETPTNPDTTAPETPENPDNKQEPTEEIIKAHFYIRDDNKNRPEGNVNDASSNYTDSVYFGSIKKVAVTNEGDEQVEKISLKNGEDNKEASSETDNANTKYAYKDTGINTVEDLLREKPGKSDCDKALRDMGYTQEQIDAYGLTINWYRTMFYNETDKKTGEKYYHVDGEVVATIPDGTGKKEPITDPTPVTPDPTPVTPDPAPLTPDPDPTPTPEPTPTPTPEPTPTPDPAPVTPNPTPTQEPTPTSTPDPTPASTPEPTPIPDSQPTVIEEEETPLAETPDVEEEAEEPVEIEDEETPLADTTDEEETTEIEDEETPLSDNPQTGDSFPLAWTGLALVAAGGLAVSRKRKLD